MNKKLLKRFKEYEMSTGEAIVLAWIIAMFVVLPLLVKVIFPLLEKWGL